MVWLLMLCLLANPALAADKSRLCRKFLCGDDVR